MKSRLLQRVGIIATAVVLAAPAAAYNPVLARDYAEMFEPATGAATGKNLHFMNAEKFVAAVRKGEKITVVDVRTPGEVGFFGANLPGNRAIPMSELFKAENLDSLPEDGKIVVLCKSGTRASAAVAALRHIGFHNTYLLKGGYKGLASYLGAKEAYAPLGPEAAAR
jgi:rhodanese-related sulfurtransferase